MDKKVYGALEKLMEETMKGAGAIKGDKGDPGAPGKDGLPGEDGVGISSIEKTSTNGLVDTYTITYDDGGTTTFHVTNGKDGKDGEGGSGGAVTEEQIESVVNKYLTENPLDKIVNPLYDASGFTKSSIEVMTEMKIGYNLGNYFDSCKRGSEGSYTIPNQLCDQVQFYETLWGNLPVTENLIKYLASIGVTAIRLPATWYNLYDDNYSRVSDEWLARVREVVDLIISHGLYCIINMHHDGYARTNTTRLILDDARELSSMKYFANVWKQVAEYFKDYGYKLLFEDMNEACDYNKSMTANATRTAVAKKFHNEFLRIVRNSGGNNDKRFCVLPNYAGLALMGMDGIEDTATDKLLATGHDYSGNASGTVSQLSSYVNEHGIGAIMDECGVSPADSTTYAKELREKVDALETPVSTFWWDNGQREFNLVNRYYCEPTSKALGEYVGLDLPLNTYAKMKDRTQPYYAKFRTKDTDGIWGKEYVMVCSQNPITSLAVATKHTNTGYYDLLGIDGGLFSTYVSDDGENWTICETRIATQFARVKWGGFNLYGSTESTYWYEGNYEIPNVPTAPQEPIACTGINLDKDTLSFSTLEPQTLVATVEPEDTTDTVIWSTEDSTIATVDNGVVTPTSNGITTITATCGNYSATCSVAISVPSLIECTGITLDNSSLEFTDTTTQTLTATVTPADCTQPMTWTSSDETVATVLNGVVTPIKTGTTTITSTCGSKSATCEVTVTISEEVGDIPTIQEINFNNLGKINNSASATYDLTDKENGGELLFYDSATDTVTMYWTGKRLNKMVDRTADKGHNRWYHNVGGVDQSVFMTYGTTADKGATSWSLAPNATGSNKYVAIPSTATIIGCTYDLYNGDELIFAKNMEWVEISN